METSARPLELHSQIGPDPVELYRACITATDDDTYDKATRDLHQLLVREPWRVKITDTSGELGEPPAYYIRHHSVTKVEDRLAARDLRRQLDAAIQ